MKSCVKSMLVVLAIVMSFVAVQVVWAGTIDPNNTIPVEGTVVSFHDPTGIVLEDATVDDDEMEGTVTVGGIGPDWFWEEQSAIPAVNDTVKIQAYELVLSDDATTLIACSIVINSNDEILLRNEDGSPVWNKKPPAETTVSSFTGDGICDGSPGCTCPDCQDDCIPNEYLGPGPHGKQGN